jgi:asparagine synthase (glutamine-hydrolysing)
MCGIAGVASPDGASLELVNQMGAAIRHRGPDDEGYVVLDDNGAFHSFRGDDTVSELEALPHWQTAGERHYRVGLCSRRLSILDLTSAGHQPMLSADENLALAFNGEIYNYLELARELEALGWRLRPCGDTAVLLAAFAEWGPACVQRFRGMWAFAIFDRAAGRLTLSRDRFGIKPLYYTRLGDAIAFSSEIKGLLPILPREPRGSISEAVRLLAWGGVDVGQATLFEDVQSIPAGSQLYVENDGAAVRLHRYYDVASLDGKFEGGLEEAIQEYRDRVRESIRLHMRSDVEVGACLSGGLDSNLLAKMAGSELTNGHLRTFTAVYDDPTFDERRYVELHASRSNRLRTSFVAPTAEELLEELDRLVWAQDQPLASSSPFAQWSVMQLAGEQGVKVLLDGQGADEAIGGYSYFAGAYLLELARAGRLLRGAHEALLLRERRSVNVWSELARAGYHQLPSWLRAHARRVTRDGFRVLAAPYRDLPDRKPRPGQKTFRDYSVQAVRENLPSLLRYEDRSSMAFSIESRVPYLDHPLVEFVLSLPTEFKIQNGWSKFVQRKSSEALLPEEIVWRRDKLGFATPQEAWKRDLTGPLRGFLQGAELPPFLDRSGVEALLSNDSSRPTTLSEFWKTILFLKWIDVFRVRFSE